MKHLDRLEDVAGPRWVQRVVERSACDGIYFAREQRFEFFLDLEQVTQAVPVSFFRVQNVVDVAFRAEVFAQHGAEQSQSLESPPFAERVQLVSIGPESAQDAFELLGHCAEVAVEGHACGSLGSRHSSSPLCEFVSVPSPRAVARLRALWRQFPGPRFRA